jgi:RNA polymerase sigma factor (sigma-70 family)
MPKNSSLTQNDFDALLLWFSPDREVAGAKYEEIRNGLIRYFSFKGCSEEESLADETINRVAKKLDSLNTDNNFKHITYFYGFASKIYLENRNKPQNRTTEFEPSQHSNLVVEVDDTKENRHQCLDSCLTKVSPEERNLAIEYFSKEKSAKIEHRRKLAEKLNINVGTMHVRIHRLKDTLRNCVENCLTQK